MSSPMDTLQKPTGQMAAQASDLAITKGVKKIVHRVVFFGPGGVGKSSMAVGAKQLGMGVLCVDCEGSTAFLDVERIEPTNWLDLRAGVREKSLGFGMVFIDTLTIAEEMAREYVLGNVKHEKGKEINGIEDYGYGKGYVHVYEEFLKLLGDLDGLVRQGIHVVGICHDCIAAVPNPGGDDWIRYEPRLQLSKNASVRHRVKEWCDHLLYIGFDTAVEDGKAKGTGTRTIYSAELPSHWAKSRSISEPVVYKKHDPEIWKLLFAKGS